MLVSTALTLLSAVGSAVGTGVSSAMSANRNRKAIKALDGEHKIQQREYDRMYNSDYLSRSDIMNTLNRRKELASQQYSRSRKLASNFGGTGAYLDAENANNNNWINQTYSAIGANSATYKQGIKQAQMAESQECANRKASLYQAQADTIAKAGGQVTEAMAGIETNANAYGDKKLSFRKAQA